MSMVTALQTPMAMFHSRTGVRLKQKASSVSFRTRKSKRLPMPCHR
jgi:hypothetical protein